MRVLCKLVVLIIGKYKEVPLLASLSLFSLFSLSHPLSHTLLPSSLYLFSLRTTLGGEVVNFANQLVMY